MALIRRHAVTAVAVKPFKTKTRTKGDIGKKFSELTYSDTAGIGSYSSSLDERGGPLPVRCGWELLALWLGLLKGRGEPG